MRLERFYFLFSEAVVYKLCRSKKNVSFNVCRFYGLPSVVPQKKRKKKVKLHGLFKYSTLYALTTGPSSMLIDLESRR